MAAYSFITPLGVIVPDTADLKADVVSEWREAFGQDLVVDDETPQGVIINMEAEARDSVARNNAELANQINPDQAGGVFIDGIWALTRGKRRPAVRSVIPGAVLSGVPFTVVPAGSLASVDPSGDLFRTKSTVVIAADGSVAVDFESVEFGAIAAPAGTLVVVASGVLGWESVTNPTQAALGREQESDIAARRRRLLTLALQGVALPEAIISRLYDIDGVDSLVFRENVTNVAATIDGVLLAPHSIYVCISGGTDVEVATALLDTKSLGANWNGATTVAIVEPFSGQTYNVKFDRATPIPVFARITAKFNGLDGTNIIKDAVVAYSKGELPGDAGFGVGDDVSPFELAGAVNQVEPRIVVTLVELSTDGVTYGPASIPISIQEQATITAGSVSVVPV